MNNEIAYIHKHTHTRRKAQLYSLGAFCKEEQGEDYFSCRQLFLLKCHFLTHLTFFRRTLEPDQIFI